MKKSQKRIDELKERITTLEKLRKLAKQGKLKLEGHRPHIALQMELSVLKMELARAKQGKEPMYKTQWYSDL